jgi:hypothetical protein
MEYQELRDAIYAGPFLWPPAPYTVGGLHHAVCGWRDFDLLAALNERALLFHTQEPLTMLRCDVPVLAPIVKHGEACGWSFQWGRRWDDGSPVYRLGGYRRQGLEGGWRPLVDDVPEIELRQGVDEAGPFIQLSTSELTRDLPVNMRMAARATVGLIAVEVHRHRG